MSQKGLEQLIGKVLADGELFNKLLKDPDGAIKETGLDISPEELAQIKQVNKEKAKKFAESFATEFGGRKQYIP